MPRVPSNTARRVAVKHRGKGIVTIRLCFTVGAVVAAVLSRRPGPTRACEDMCLYRRRPCQKRCEDACAFRKHFVRNSRNDICYLSRKLLECDASSHRFQPERQRHRLASFFGRFFLRRLSLSRRRSLRGFLGRGGFLSARRGSGRFFFGRLFVGGASVICNIKSRALEDQTCASTKQAFHLAVSPFW